MSTHLKKAVEHNALSVMVSLVGLITALGSVIPPTSNCSMMQVFLNESNGLFLHRCNCILRSFMGGTTTRFINCSYVSVTTVIDYIAEHVTKATCRVFADTASPNTDKKSEDRNNGHTRLPMNRQLCLQFCRPSVVCRDSWPHRLTLLYVCEQC